MKLKAIIYCLLFALFFTSTPVQKAFALMPEDQSMKTVTTSKSIFDNAQTFQNISPGRKRYLDAVSIYLQSSTTVTYNVKIIGIAPPYGSSSTVSRTIAAGSGWQVFDFSPNIDLDAFQAPSLLVETPSDNGASWGYNSDGNSYQYGCGYLNGGCETGVNGDFAFITYGSDTPAGPIITSLLSHSITTNSAAIYWATANVLSTSIVEYGTTTAYGSFASSSYLVNSHILTLNSLSPGTTYHYRVRSTDESGNSTASGDNTFTTSAEGSGDDSGEAGNQGSSPDNSTANPSTDTPGNNTQTVAPVSAENAKKSVDLAIPVPTLISVTANGIRTDVPIKEVVSLAMGGILVVNGKSFAGANVAVTIGDKTFAKAADRDGIWEMAINSAELAVGDYIVKAQAQDIKKDKGSNIVELFSLKIDDKTVSETVKDISASQPTANEKNAPQTLWNKLINQYKNYTLGVLIVFALGLSVLFYLIRKKIIIPEKILPKFRRRVI